MRKLPKIQLSLRRNLWRSHYFWWLVTLVGLGGIYLLARRAEPTNLDLYQQLLVLYVIDSLLFFFTDWASAKMGILTLIFLATMEVIVVIFLLITLYSIGRI